MQHAEKHTQVEISFEKVVAVIVIVIAAVFALVTMVDYYRAPSVRDAELAQVISKRNFGNPVDEFKYLIEKADAIDVEFRRKKLYFASEENRSNMQKKYSSFAIGVWKEALLEFPADAYVLLFSLDASNAISHAEIQALRREKAQALTEFAKNTEEKVDLYAIAAGLSSSGGYLPPNAKQTVLFTWEAWKRGDSHVAALASNIAYESKRYKTALLWSLRCIGECQQKYEPKEIEKKLSAIEIEAVQNLAADKTVGLLSDLEE